VNVEVGRRQVALSTLDRVLWPASGGTKSDLVRYFTAMSEVILPQLAGHPLTLHRFPGGVDGQHFYQTRAPSHPSWIRAVTLRTPKAGKVFDVIVLDETAALVWAANISAIELHPYLGTAEDFDRPTAVVFDLDPGPPADLLACCDVALVLREVLDGLGLRSWVKVSGANGLHVHVPVDGAGGFAATKRFARAVGELLTRRLPGTVVTTMARDRRVGRVLVDWSQNDPWKSTVAAYSPRGLALPTVAAPVTWDEVEQAAARRATRPLRFLIGDMPGRLDRHGDIPAAVLALRQTLPDR
jgi:bifunctional non-homologous end joining protein LigD